MFDSVYACAVTPGQYFGMALAALPSGILFAWLMSFRIRSTRRFFIVSAMIPFIVATVITFVSGNIGAGVAFGGAFALTRFRSAQGSADEIASVLIAMAAGVPFGMGYLAYGVLLLVVMPLLFVGLSSLTIFDHPGMTEELLLRVDDIFSHYLKSVENAGVKTTGMGSMFRLSYKIKMKDRKEEKAFIDELRTKNGNLEIAVLPFVEAQNHL